MINRYIKNGTMYVLNDNEVKAECMITDEGNNTLEIKILPQFQNIAERDMERACKISGEITKYLHNTR